MAKRYKVETNHLGPRNFECTISIWQNRISDRNPHGGFVYFATLKQWQKPTVKHVLATLRYALTAHEKAGRVTGRAAAYRSYLKSAIKEMQG